MSSDDFMRRRWVRWCLFAGLWTIVGLSFANQFYLSSSKSGRPVSWAQALSYSLSDWYVFALLSVPAAWLARRFPFERGDWRRPALVHLAGSVAFSLAYMVVRTWVAQGQGGLAGQQVSFNDAFSPLLVKTSHFNFLIYWVIVTVSHALAYYRKFHERELRTVELERRLTEAKLQALQMQLNPHFLFNSLHSISALMHRDVEAADEMLMRLSDLLRRALDNTDTQEVTLRQELEFLQLYLVIEQTRFGDRLSVRTDVAPETLEAPVPNLVLQPLVENAIKHGIEPHARRGVIELSARRDGDRLLLQVQDNGAGLPAGAAPDEGVGLSNTRARLRQLYGDAHQFEFQNAPGGGLQVRVVIPFRGPRPAVSRG